VLGITNGENLIEVMQPFRLVPIRNDTSGKLLKASYLSHISSRYPIAQAAPCSVVFSS